MYIHIVQYVLWSQYNSSKPNHTALLQLNCTILNVITCITKGKDIIITNWQLIIIRHQIFTDFTDK